MTGTGLDCEALGFGHVMRQGACRDCGYRPVLLVAKQTPCAECGTLTWHVVCQACRETEAAYLRECARHRMELDDGAEAEHEQRADILLDHGRIGDE